MKLCYRCYLKRGLKEITDLPSLYKDGEEMGYERCLSVLWEYPVYFSDNKADIRRTGETIETCDECGSQGLYVREVDFKKLRNNIKGLRINWKED